MHVLQFHAIVLQNQLYHLANTPIFLTELDQHGMGFPPVDHLAWKPLTHAKRFYRTTAVLLL